MKIPVWFLKFEELPYCSCAQAIVEVNELQRGDTMQCGSSVVWFPSLCAATC